MSKPSQTEKDIAAALNPPKTEWTTEAGSRAASCSPSVEEFLAEENRQLRKAGCKLAEAALHVTREYDGVHRLMLAVSEWATAVANEGGRGKANSIIESKVFRFSGDWGYGSAHRTP